MRYNYKDEENIFMFVIKAMQKSHLNKEYTQEISEHFTVLSRPCQLK